MHESHVNTLFCAFEAQRGTESARRHDLADAERTLEKLPKVEQGGCY